MASRHHRPRRATAVAALAAAALVVPALGACSKARAAADCAALAKNLTKDVEDLRRNIDDDSKDPQSAQEFIDNINRDLGKLTKRTDDDSPGDSDLKDAIGEITASVDDIQDSVGDGERPDVGSLTKAVGSLTTACAKS
ncbi:hypothetical protein [Streptomyces sp. I05A-00742]|uniref:hypothetical protein n=1 Tax=Streptomyces sp. I05A-00742 TaxID=2732853 RepID=UPI0014880C63|nr:hypothetical protein [Streptomyces sp. I05A-00742]